MSLSSIKVELNKTSENSNKNVQLNTPSGGLQSSSPLSLRNAARDSSFLSQVESIQNIKVLQKVDGSSLQFNSETQNYEVKLMSLDGGNF